MKTIDFRFRPNTPDVMAIGESKMFKTLCDMIGFSNTKTQDLPEIVEELNQNGVDKAVILGRDAETTYQWKGSNDGVAKMVNQFPDKFIGFAGLDPHKGMAAIHELNRSVNQLGLKGASIDPYLAQIYVNDAKYYPIYAKCCELDIPIVITTGPATLVPNAVIDHVAPRYIDFVARDFPELTMVVSHGAYPWVNEMITVAQRNSNVYLDISEYEFFPMSEAYVQGANTIISDKLLFASAHPFVHFKDALKNYQKLPFTDEVRQKVMYKNAARILKLDQSC
ncbi:amidohydrolase family protein [Desulforamulus ruminis]|uniref:Amidohydrolase 2 n=1 Tax=Desulforamulus ruminis (strain ATCC 23193 / DSM 2154 / NCIMB 8452 / DL) TaxID=696281 RepID=F6DRK4_DESRL|nr:amidohydrolase family protein [Desulforamulus ruminis]AEG58758.1 amidohydrolase 2 [Desulforamulus ruminis DSM 2154]